MISDDSYPGDGLSAVFAGGADWSSGLNSLFQVQPPLDLCNVRWPRRLMPPSTLAWETAVSAV